MQVNIRKARITREVLIILCVKCGIFRLKSDKKRVDRVLNGVLTYCIVSIICLKKEL